MLATLQARGCSKADASTDTGLLCLRACAALAKPAERLVDVVHGDHDAEAAKAFTGAFR